jgi:hypothetical protein
MKKQITESKDEITKRYGSGERVEVCTINGTPHLVLGERTVSLNNDSGVISIPGHPYAGTFTSPSAAADWVFTEDRLPISNISHVRRDFLDLDAAERDRLAAAFNHVHSLGLIDDFAQMHVDGWPSPSAGGPNVHFTPQFLPWHRWMVREMEKAMQRFDPLVTIPYWDSTRDEANDWDGPMLGDFFGGEENSGGRFDHWDILRNRDESLSMPSKANVLRTLRQPGYFEMRQLEGDLIHRGAHQWAGGRKPENGPAPGYMARKNSPKDPLFYLHHCNVDRIWALWQLNHPDVFPQYDTRRGGFDDADPLYEGGPIPYDAITIDDPLFIPPYISGWSSAPTIRDVLSHRSLGYRYANDPRLEEYTEDILGEPLISGDPDAFTVAPHRIEVEANRGSWKTFTFQLINDTDFSVRIDIEGYPENPQGQVDGFVWFPLHITLQPQDSHDHFVVFAPQHAGWYNFTMKVHIDPVGSGVATEKTIPVIGTSN